MHWMSHRFHKRIVKEEMDDSNPLRRLLEQETDSNYRLTASHNYVVESKSVIEHLFEDCSPSPRSSFEDDGITDALRCQIAKWSFEIVDYFNLSRESASIALNYVDRYMVAFHNTNKNKASGKVPRNTYKLLTTTSIYVAIKVHGIAREPNGYAFKPSVDIFVNLTQNQFTEIDITTMELKLCETLKWKLNPPLPVFFLEGFLDLLPDWQVGDASCNKGCHVSKAAIYELACYFSEVSACVSNFTFLFKPSSIGCASILSAIDCLTNDSVHSSNMPPKTNILTFLDRALSHTAQPDQGDHEIRAAKLVLRKIWPGRLIPRVTPYSSVPVSTLPCEAKTYPASPKRGYIVPTRQINHPASEPYPLSSQGLYVSQFTSTFWCDSLRRRSAKRKYSAAFEWTTVDILRR